MKSSLVLLGVFSARVIVACASKPKTSATYHLRPEIQAGR